MTDVFGKLVHTEAKTIPALAEFSAHQIAGELLGRIRQAEDAGESLGRTQSCPQVTARTHAPDRLPTRSILILHLTAVCLVLLSVGGCDLSGATEGGSLHLSSGTTPAAANWGTDLLDGIEARFVSTSGASFLKPYPMSSLEMPVQGRAVVDPEFGTTIRRISDAQSERSQSGKYGIRTLYSGTPAWNLDQTLLLGYSPGSGYLLYRGGSTRHTDGPLEGEPDYSLLGKLALSGINHPTDFERLYWSADRDDPAAPRTLFFPNQRHQIMKLVLSERQPGKNFDLAVVHDFRQQCGDFGWGHQLITDTHYWTSFDGKTWGFKCGPNPGAQVFAYDMETDSVLWQKTYDGHEKWALAGVPVATPSGDYFIVHTDQGFSIWDRRGESAGEIPLKMEHATMTLSGAGDLYVTTVFDEPAALSGTIVSCSIPEGACSLVAGRRNGLPYPPSGTHHSGIGYLNPGWVATSVVGFAPLDGREVLNQELLLTDLRQPQAPRVARIAHHRSARAQNPLIDNHYWQEPHPVISPDGCRIAFTSDWSAGRPESEMYSRTNLFVLELPCFEATNEGPSTP